MLKAMGVQPFVADLFLMVVVGGFGGFWLELKAPGKKPTAGQLAFLSRARANGYAAHWFDNWERAKEAIEIYLVGKWTNMQYK